MSPAACQALRPSTVLCSLLCGHSPPHPWPPVFMASICSTLGTLVRTGRALDAHCVPSLSLAVPSLSWCHTVPWALCPAIPSVGPSQSVKLWALHLLAPLEAPSCPVSCPLPTPGLVSVSGSELSAHWGQSPTVSLSAGSKEQDQHPSLGSCPPRGSLDQPLAVPPAWPSPAHSGLVSLQAAAGAAPR